MVYFCNKLQKCAKRNKLLVAAGEIRGKAFVSPVLQPAPSLFPPIVL